MLLAVQIRYSVEAGVLILALCVIIGPLVAERLRIPGMLGLIAAGALLGPSTLDWLRPGGLVATIGAAGLLYLMFVAGVELDLPAFRARRAAAITFGLLTFIVPFALSYVVGRYYLDLGLSATALVGAMWASHTVVAYPEVKAAAVDRSAAVGVSLAATVITDVIALVILAVAASSTALEEAPEVAGRLAAGTLETDTTLPLWVGLVLLVVVCFAVIPVATRWLFAHVLFERSQRFVWVLVAMSAGAISGLLGGVEGLVGAFLAGIGINTSIPARGALMERIEFIGGSLLIPAFLISVGLAIDPRALADRYILGVALLFTATVVVGKVVAAAIAGALFSFDRVEIALMASLTIGQAAATLAIAQVGVETGLFDTEIRDAAIVTVGLTVLVTSIGTRLAARRMPSAGTGERLGDHVLVVASDAADPAALADLTTALLADDGGVVTPCAVRTSRRAAFGPVPPLDSLRDLHRALVRRGLDTESVERVAETRAAGAGQLADEVGATLLVVPSASAAEVRAIAEDTDVPVVGVWLGPEPWKRVLVMDGGATESAADVAGRIAERLAVARGVSPVELARSDELVPAGGPTDDGGAVTRPAPAADDLLVLAIGDGSLPVEPTTPGSLLVVGCGLGSAPRPRPGWPMLGTVLPASEYLGD